MGPSSGESSVRFASAVHRMQGPKPYEISARFAPAEPFPDGELLLKLARLTKSENIQPSNNLVILLDTSGSMLKRLEGKRRYQIAQGISTRIDVIGFEVDDDDVLSTTFQAWAQLGQGAYFNARGSDELGKALTEMTQLRYRIEHQGKIIRNGVINNTTISLPVGSYQLFKEGAPEAMPFDIQAHTLTEIDVTR